MLRLAQVFGLRACSIRDGRFRNGVLFYLLIGCGWLVYVLFGVKGAYFLQ